MLSSYSNFDKFFYKGNSFDFGDFDRCLEIDVTDLRNASLKGKHCLIQYQSLGNRTLSILPSIKISTHAIKICVFFYFVRSGNVESRLEKNEQKIFRCRLYSWFLYVRNDFGANGSNFREKRFNNFHWIQSRWFLSNAWEQAVQGGWLFCCVRIVLAYVFWNWNV